MFSVIYSFFAAINGQDIIEALNIFWKGMLAIFLVIGLVILITYLLNRFANRKDAPPSEDEPDDNSAG